MKSDENLQKANMTNNGRFLLFALVGINTCVLLWLLLKGPITNYWRKLEIKSHANIGNILIVDLGCQELGTKEGLKSCSDSREKYKYLETKFNGLIDSYDTISCNFFSDKNEAQQFYEYVGGVNTLNNIKMSQKYDEFSIKFHMVTNKKQLDPYNLDSNNDGYACESLADPQTFLN